MHQLLLQSSLLFLFFAPISFSQDECGPSQFPCGDITLNISYPFHVNSTESCSYPDFEITCNDNLPQIEIGSRAYVVKNIDYEKSVLTIVDREFLSSPCPLPSNNITLKSSLLDYTSDDQSIIFYYCSSVIQIPGDFHQVPCLPTTGNYAYFTTNESHKEFSNCIARVVSVPIDSVDRLLQYPETVGDVLKEGFDLTWESGLCGPCVGTEVPCAPNTDQRPTCLCSSPLTCRTGQGKSIGTKLILGVTVGIGSFLLVCLLFCLLFHKKGRDNVRKKRKSNAHNVEAFLQNYGSLTPQRYSYSDIKKMTSSFIDKLGQGGFGAVFKGKLRDGRLVAVKILSESKGGEEFINEVASIGKTYHVNIVSLLGFCAEGSKRALVYEFMPNGSLEKFIYAEKSRETDTLGWETLYQIAVGIAKGLEYLHRGCSTRILHFDIKPHNILLDHDFCPKISDFGLAKLCPNKESIISTLDARGTVGYIAPEVFCRNIGRASHKSDVYSYGMMMLEIVGRRKNVDDRVEKTSEIYFPHWIFMRLDINDDLGLHGVTTEEEEKTARKMILVGLWCIQTDPANRPSMNRVLEMLEGTLESLQMPPKPFLSSPKRSSHDSSTTSMIITEGSP
ncbi:LEAF RUST 10 DISEASE-RESISTANCE LOCUS RECEPTOR-LIKE PROTEIN KINASE-like 2.1 isoform X2 [Tasmannia lanceolata]|uniref:LEAF RUST 10 DISEASE-RESISTANCE LOCUS RECEPTOR-LIKE PROTEIN KINASE-like 2.1 isoform X2 n=1 Tax=Tasmannia lanceolata TaxID=3420 RepID=UPI004063A936